MRPVDPKNMTQATLALATGLFVGTAFVPTAVAQTGAPESAPASTSESVPVPATPAAAPEAKAVAPEAKAKPAEKPDWKTRANARKAYD